MTEGFGQFAENGIVAIKRLLLITVKKTVATNKYVSLKNKWEMKKMMITMMASILVSTTVFAQDDKKQDKHHERKFDKTEMVKHHTDETVKRYQLNDKQAKQLLALNNKYADKMKPQGPHRHHGHHGMGQPPKDRKDMKGKRPEPPKEGQDMKGKRPERPMDDTMKAYEAELQKIMTPEQYKSYKVDMEKRREQGPRPPRQNGPDQ